MEVVVYTGPRCVKCDTLKRLLTTEGIEFTSKSVMENMQEASALAIRTVPTTIIYENGEIIARFTSTDLEGIKEVVNAD